ncbi:glycosyltransferase family 2 protein [Nitrosomonas sp.]|uniref:glycosyltransferase family 2 protein n=1 Tax=Nitrosomonas sp. TaxID=42353 RepID=UPI0025D1054E|nr:glycosyltransferase family 2 protein [Nitrosomonas sp.]
MTVPSYAEVSVVIPCFRCAETIERAVLSVAKQTLRPAEVILVDDCSNDGTFELLQHIQRRHTKGWIKVIVQQINQGPGSARNAGWEIAKQPYIAFLDADDAWHPQKIEIQWRWMKTHPEVALTGHASRIISDNQDTDNDFISNSQSQFYPVSSYQHLFMNRFPTRSVMLRRNLPYRFVDGKRASEDFLLWSEILLDGYSAWRSDLRLALVFKAEYGERGLSSNLWSMEKGQLDSYFRLYTSKRLNVFYFSTLYFYSIAKYIRRVLVVVCRQWSRKR